MSRRLPFALLVCLFGCAAKTAGELPADGGGDSTPPGTDAIVEDEGVPADTEPPPFDAGPPKLTSKLDLLFVVDNSISMADKQAELARAIPVMIRDLVSPSTDPSGKAFTSLHVGVITTSLGSHGTSACAVEITSRSANDRGHLLPRSGEGSGSGFAVSTGGTVVSAACPSPVTASPITWAFDASAGSADYYSSTGAIVAGTATSCVILSAREQGCGYEEGLEAMYHFLIDPAPYAKAEVRCTFGISGDACGSNRILIEGLDSELLAQRAAFLRPDSTVAIAYLSDENDFSLKPAGLNWLPWGYGKGQMQRGWSGCSTAPDSFEPESVLEFNKLHDEYRCYSCFENTSNPNCSVPWASVPLNNDVDGRNLRGFHQVQRYGYNFLWGRQRYVDGLTKGMVFGSDQKLAPNPLFAGGMRTAGNVIFAAIVGVPPNLVSNPDGTPKSLTSADWQKLVGDTGRDLHMIESIQPRTGLPRYAGDRTIDPVSGGERDIQDGDDLQYACIAPRSTTVGGNDCEGTSPASRSPLCGTDGTQQYYKAYPGLRQLRIVQALNGYAASICEPRLGNALKGLVTRIRPLIK